MIRVYEYGLLPPDTRSAALIDQQIFAAHRYRNMLTEIERERRAAVRAALGEHGDVEARELQITPLVERLEALRTAAKLAKGAARSRKVDPETRAEIRRLANSLRPLREQAKAARTAAREDPAIAAAIAAAGERAAERKRDERKKSGAYWGTYLIVEEADDAARASKAPPDFRRWDHGEISRRQEDGSIAIVDEGDEGRISVQLQGGRTPDQLDTDRYLQILPGRPRGRQTEAPACARVLRMRVDSDGRSPIWAEWPMVMHRPIPAEAKIKVATVSRRRRDVRRWDWRVAITVELPDEARRPVPASGMLALNLGWCQRDDGSLRVGYLVGDDGFEKELVLPREVIVGFTRADGIRSVRDRNLDAMRPALAAAIAALGETAPEWLRVRTAHLVQWRSAMRFTRLAFAWRTARADGRAAARPLIDAWRTQDFDCGTLIETWRAQHFRDNETAAFALLEAWRYRDEHLQCYEAGARRGAKNRRRDIYRNLAAEFSGRYRTLVVDDTDLRQFQRSPTVESNLVEITPVKHQQRLAAPGLLRLILVAAFAEIRHEKCANVTATCSSCGSIEGVGIKRLHTCSVCGVQWDQDANAGRNLLRRQRERPNAAGGTETARVEKASKSGQSRFQRHREAKAARCAG